MKKMMMKVWTKMMYPVKNEKGAQSLEWLGLAALLILVLGIISQAVDGQKDGIGKVIENILNKINQMVG
ncbi:hypothetical protein C0966_15955 [Bacillus methanolicus]|uniref:Uncharacterized protein n=1 Tax=Bacillus methanolicus PB1 TaxID=997296 RepID=I3E025_BACMT|nr:hypothetical protein [Bacillus methanolicus]EIJ79846.1 hypothetical protein PB1_05757 [Bacillus methanolicus PB1]MDE3840769.1 hypothetical protein [Bacillus methanolicus]